MIDFKEKIRLNNEGSYDLTNELIVLATSRNTFKTTMTCKLHPVPYSDEMEGDIILQLPRWRPKYSDGVTHEEKLARNFRVWITQYVKIANGERDKKTFEGTQLEMMQGDDPLDRLYTLFIARGVHIYKDDFDLLPRSFWDDLERDTDFYYMDKYKSEFNQFLNILPRINREKQKMMDYYVPMIEESLLETLPLVNLDMTETQIIGFIAKSTKQKVDRKLTKFLGTKVHNINGEKYWITKKDIQKNKFKHTKPELLLGINKEKLSIRQSIFFSMLETRMQQEIDAINIENFTFDKDGKAIGINKRHFAGTMDMEESSFKHRLRRIQNIA